MKIFALLLSIFICTIAIPVQAKIPEKVFAPYVDVCNWPEFSIKSMYAETGQKYYTLAFITSDQTGNPAWGGVIPLGNEHYKEQIDYIRSVGGDVIISCGGANGTELALAIKNVDQLQAAYQSLIDMYDLKWIDFDIEGAAVADRPSIERRNKVIKKLQIKNPYLKVAFCLPVLPQGLTHDGLYVIQNAKENGVRIDVVNVMAMDYGDWAAPSPEGEMGSYAIDAAEKTHNQMLDIQINTKIGITPMIGQNDAISERFYVSDANKLYKWATGQDWVCLLSMWSCNRDNGKCPGGSAQASCSGVDQIDFAFTKAFLDYSFGDGGNKYPQIKITSPSDKDTFNEGDEIVINAEASDPDGNITQVEFFSNSDSLGIDVKTPFKVEFLNMPSGSFILTSVATDNDGATRTSAPVQIFVGDVCTAPSWEAEKVYYLGDVVSHQNKEWRAKWWTRNQPPGTTGQWGVWQYLGSCGSDDNNINPTAIITSPENGDSFIEGDDITITADADDKDGSVEKVEFYNGSDLIGVDNKTPYSIKLINVSIGSWDLKAIAFDDKGAKGSSDNVTIKVKADDNDSDCSFPEWDPNENWGSYEIGDKRVNNGKLWECKNIAYSYWEPSGPYGQYGWVYIKDCK